ncbi:unannotated protein [freshwater metagenome]|uniref:Unannotated protein n=1 Tax=freshwater metagenome TaxID=449393 RepID=A0A6J6YL92_9ZZZZ
MFEETPAAPPAAAAIESTINMRSAPGTLPSRSTNPASCPIAVIVPIVSKKSASNSVKTINKADTTEILLNEPKRLNWPSSPKSGVATTESGIAGTFKPQPFGFTLPVAPSKLGPIFNEDSITIATTVETTIPIRSAALTLRTMSPIIRSRPKPKTRTGQPTKDPPSPRVTGTGPAAVRRTNPASTKPIKAIKRPIPTDIATFNCVGTALNTATRNPVRTKTVMIKPSRTTKPIASAHVICEAMPTATKVFNPRPVASASGKFATTPIRIVITPATSAVAAAISARLGASPPPRNFPSPSLANPIINGLSATIYAIVKKVTMPPRTSCPTVEPRCEILK